MTSQLSVSPSLSSATSVPQSAPYANRWRAVGVSYHGCPIYVNHFDGTMAYEADGDRLVSLPEEVEEAVVDTLLAQWQLAEGCLQAPTGRAN